MRVGRIMSIVRELLSVELIQATEIRSYPKALIATFRHAHNYVGAQGVWIESIVLIGLKRSISSIPIDQSASVRS